MDATTNQKTLSGVLVALLVGSVLMPGALAVHTLPNPTSGVATAWVDVGLSTVSTTVGTYTQNTNVQSTVTFATPYDLTITNISGVSQGDSLYLFRHGSATSVTAATAVQDLENGAGKFNATFANTVMNAVGFWYVNQSGGANVAKFVVSAQPNLQVVLNPNTFAYSTTPVSFTVTVTNLSAGHVGTPVADAALSGATIPSGLATDAAGARTIFGALPAAGTHLITATRDYNGDGIPELTGNATLTVTAAQLTVSGTNTVFAGFADTASWDVRFPTGSNVFGNTAGAINTTNGVANWQYANLTVTLPNGTPLFVNMTTGATGGICGVSTWAATGLGAWMRMANGSDPCFVPTTVSAENPVLTFATTGANVGRLTFRPAAQWTAGTYGFNLVVSTVGGTSGGVFNSAPEYTVNWNQATSAPQAVNLKAFWPTGSSTQVTATENYFEVRAATLGSSLGNYDIDLSIIGSTATEFPTTLGWDAFTTANVTVTGDVLNGTGFNTVSLGSVATNGRVMISDIVPTKVNGVVNLNVNWKNVTTTLSLPIREGADSSVDKPEIVVDQTSTISVTVRDVFGNPVPSATLRVLQANGGSLYPGVAGLTVNGTGGPGLGQGGVYTLNVRPIETGDMIVYTTIGTTGNLNYSYVKVRVAPAHDLAVTLGTNSSMAGNTTYVYLNATTAEGIAVTTPNNYRVYFLNQTVLGELRKNGTSALSGLGSGAPNFQSLTGSGTGAQVTSSGAALSGAHLNVSLDPGTWYVYACSNMTVSNGDCTTAKHDNINNTPTFTVAPWHAVFTPAQIASNAQLQSNTAVTVKVTNGANYSAPQGSLIRVRSGVGHATPAIGTLSLNNTGEASFTVTGASIGDLVFEQDVNGGSAHWTALDTPFRVVGPNVQVTPDRIPLGRPATLVISVKSLNSTPLTGLGVRVCGIPIGGNATCTGEVYSDASGLATVGVNPTSTGTLTLEVSNVSAGVNVTVFAGLDVLLSSRAPQANDTQEITVVVIGQTGGETGVMVNVTRNGTAVSGFPQTTGSSGRVVVPNLQPGNYTVTASKNGFDAAMATFTVSPTVVPPTSQARFTLSNLSAPASANVGQGITVTAVVSNTGNAAGTANVLLLVNGAVRDSQQVPIGPGGSETVAFDFTPNTAGTFNVTVRLAGGDTLPARSVSVGTPTTTSPVTTSPVTTSPVTTSPVTTSPVTTSPVTTTPTTTTPATPSPEVPGFEVVALVGALAVALLVLRRRN